MYKYKMQVGKYLLLLLQCNPKHFYSKVNSCGFSGIYFQVNMHRIVALNKQHYVS